MVQSQLQPNGVQDKHIQQAFLAVDRARFVSEELQGSAYADENLPLTPGRFLLAPLTLARMIQAAAVTKHSHVLAVGCATGYSCAVLRQLAASVVGVESDPILADAAITALAGTGIGDVTIACRPLQEGMTEQSPYNMIFIEGLVQHIPAILLGQLAESGVLTVFHPSGDQRMARLVLYRKLDGEVFSHHVMEASAPALAEFGSYDSFIFHP